MRWNVSGASLSMVRVEGQSVHIELISHVDDLEERLSKDHFLY